MDHERWIMLDSALENMAEKMRSAFMTFSEAMDALSKIDIDFGFLDQEERPKYDPYNARAMWKRPCPQQKYRVKRPLQMVHYNQVARISKPKNWKGRRHVNR